MQDRRLARVDAALFVGLSLFTIASISSVPFVPTHDGPNHLANCVLANRLDAPGSPLARWIEHGGALTTQGYQYLCRPLEAALGWRDAHQVLLALLALGWAAGVAYLVRAIAPRSGLALFGFATALQWHLYMGFYNFVLSAVLGLFVLGWIVRRTSMSWADWGAFALALVLAGFAHPFPVALTGLAAALVVVLRAERRAWPALLVRLALAGLPALALTIAVHAPDTHPVEWRSFGDRLLDLGRLFAGGPLWRALPPSLVAIVGLIVALVAWARGALVAGARGLALAAAAALVAYLASPLHAPTWAFFSPRFLVLALPLAIAAVPPRVFDAARVAIASRVVCVAMAIAALAWSTAYHARLAPVVAEVLGGLDAPIRRAGPRLPLMMSTAGAEPDLLFAEPLVMMLHAYTFDQGGIDPFLFATVPSTDSILYVEQPEKLFGNLPQRFLGASLRCAGTRPDCPPLDVQYAWLAIFGRLFEDVIVFADDPHVIETFRARGYSLELQHGRLAILRPGRCRVDVHLAAAAGAIVKPPVTLSLGHPKVDRPVIVSDVDATRVAEGTTLTLEGPDCGPLWLRVDAPGLACAEGTLVPTATATAAGQASCTLGPAR